jgi:hypothetical protein
MGVAARRQRLTGALATEGLLDARHHGACRREVVRRRSRRRRVRRIRSDPGLHHRPQSGRHRERTQPPHAGGARGRNDHGHPGQLRRGQRAAQRHPQRHSRGVGEV